MTQNVDSDLDPIEKCLPNVKTSIKCFNLEAGKRGDRESQRNILWKDAVSAVKVF